MIPRLDGFFESHRIQVAAVAILAALVVVFFFQTLHNSMQVDGYDFTDRLKAANTLLGGGSPYDNLHPRFPYVYPLFLAFSVIPLAVLPYGIANAIWYLISVASLAGVVWLTIDLGRSELGLVTGRRLIVPVTAILILSIPWIQNHFLNGQVTLTDLLFCLLFYRCYVRGQTVRAALFLGLGISFKIFPAVFLLYLLLRRRFDIIGLTAAFTLFFCLIPGVLLDGSVLDAYRQYYDIFLGPIFARMPGRFTPVGFLTYFVPVPSGVPLRVFAVASALVVVAPLVQLERMRGAGVRRGEDLWLFTLYLISVPLLSPLSEVAYISFTLPATLLLVWSFVLPRAVVSRRVVVFLGVALGLLLIARRLAHPLSGIFGPDDRIGPLFFPAIVCIALAVVAAFGPGSLRAPRTAHTGADLANS